MKPTDIIRKGIEDSLEKWDYIAINDCSQYEALEALNLESDIEAFCPICEAVKQLYGKRACIKKGCIIEWPKLENSKIRKNDIVLCNDSLYGQWADCEDIELSKQIAQKISDLMLNELNKINQEND